MKSSANTAIGRHKKSCRVCAHPERKQIEDEWCAWANTSNLARKYDLSRDSIYRHCHAFNLFQKRSRNLKAALERIIERSEDVRVNASAVVSAVQAYAKINSAGQWIDRTEQIGLNELFMKMSREELEAYAQNGSLPQWFTEITGATPIDSTEVNTNG